MDLIRLSQDRYIGVVALDTPQKRYALSHELAGDIIIASPDPKPATSRGFEKMQGLRRVVYDSHDYHEGIRAFKKKRKPVFTGRQES
ncbi:MAG: hypothetical protein K9J74_11395 [Sulfuritalea sp.]|nr:hypothetical protein [Sulfuritalea sp.]